MPWTLPNGISNQAVNPSGIVLPYATSGAQTSFNKSVTICPCAFDKVRDGTLKVPTKVHLWCQYSQLIKWVHSSSYCNMKIRYHIVVHEMNICFIHYIVPLKINVNMPNVFWSMILVSWAKFIAEGSGTLDPVRLLMRYCIFRPPLGIAVSITYWLALL